MLLCWFGVVVMGLYSGFMLKTVSITRRMFSLLHRIMAFFTSHSTRERAGGTQDAGQVTADPNWSEEHSITYSIALINKIARSFSAVQGLSGLGWWQASGFFCPSYFFFLFFLFLFFLFLVNLSNSAYEFYTFCSFGSLSHLTMEEWMRLSCLLGSNYNSYKEKLSPNPFRFFFLLATNYDLPDWSWLFTGDPRAE